MSGSVVIRPGAEASLRAARTLEVLRSVEDCAKPETLERYGRGTPDDWIERIP
jgi:hypothetical protein